jgi:hypothetical protein
MSLNDRAKPLIEIGFEPQKRGSPTKYCLSDHLNPAMHLKTSFPIANDMIPVQVLCLFPSFAVTDTS